VGRLFHLLLRAGAAQHFAEGERLATLRAAPGRSRPLGHLVAQFQRRVVEQLDRPAAADRAGGQALALDLEGQQRADLGACI
jgi:hypothetical protein